MKTVMNVAEAKAKLSELMDRALRGEEVWIARNGAPVLRLTPASAETADARARRRAAFIGSLAHLGPVPTEALTAEPLDAWHSEQPLREIAAVAEPGVPFDPET